MSRRPLRVALTGGIATGKSHCLARFAALGVPVIDSDELARMAIEPGTPGHAVVVARFGPSVVSSDGTIDRAALGRVVFADANARQDLEAIVHPAVYAGIERWFSELERWSGARMGIADIPLLVETGHEGDFDRVIAVSCSREQQLARLMRRNNLAEDDARRRIDAQATDEARIARADFTIDTSGSIEDTNRQVAAVWERLRAKTA
jgi:dephospho-CoA kinase